MCSLLVIREKRIKTTVRHHSTPPRMAVVKQAVTSPGDCQQGACSSLGR